MLDVLTNPNKFFEARMKGEESLRIPVFIVLISGIIGGISAFLQNSMTVKMMSDVPPEAQSIVSIMPTASAFVAVVFSFIIWVIVATIFFGISSIFKGEGKFNRTLEFVGYGYIPKIIGGIISAVLLYNFISTAQIPAITNPMALMKSPMMLLLFIIGILFMLWSANIWVFGLKHARNLSTKNALITVAIPVALYYIIMIYFLHWVSQMGVM
jgi:hypothetical protein